MSVFGGEIDTTTAMARIATLETQVAELTDSISGVGTADAAALADEASLRLQGDQAASAAVTAEAAARTLADTRISDQLGDEILRRVNGQAAIAGAIANAAPVNNWYVSATGSSGNTGTKASPWSLTWALALANTTVQPGDFIWLMDTGGRYPAGVVAYSRGTIDRPVTVSKMAGHKVEISGALPAYEGVANQTAWTLIDAGMQIYETNVVPSPTTNNRQMLGFIWAENDWHTLMPDRWGGLTPVTPAIAQASHLYRTAGDFYPGPMLMPLTNGKVRIRLQNATAQAMRNKPTTQIADPNPANNQLKLFDANTTGFTVRGSNLIFRGLEINDVYQAFYMDTGSGAVENITIDRCKSRVGYFFCRLASARNVTISYPEIAGKMGGFRHWIGFSEVKGASTLGEGMRKCAFDTGGVQKAQIYGGKIEGFFDGILAGGMYDVEVGKFDDDPLNEAGHWVFANIFTQIVDDGMQIYSSDQKVHVHHNYWYGAGPALDGDGSGADHGSEFAIIHHNVIDARRNPIWWQREPDPTDPNYSTTDPVGIRYPVPFGGHGLGNTGAFYYPIQHYHNTLYFVTNYVQSRFESFQASFNRGIGGLPNGFTHVVANNLILVEQAGNWGWMAREVTFDGGREVYDGNLLVKPDATFNPVYRFGYRGGASVAPGNGVTTFASLKTENAGVDWAATKVGYTPGWDASSAQVSQATAGVITDGGAPILAAALTGAADLTALHLRGLSTYQPWRGAKAPLPA